MSWILLSILTAFFWALSNIVDKFIFTRWAIKPIVPVMFSGIIGTLIGAGIYFFRGLAEISPVNLVWAAAAAFFYLLGFVFYFKAVKAEEISRIIPMFFLTPLFIFLLATLFLGEKLTPANHAGIFLLVTGAVLISSKKSLDWRFGKGFWFMILSAASISANAVITKYLLDFADSWTIFSYTRGFWVLLFLLPVIYRKFSDLKDVAAIGGTKAIGMISSSITLNLTGGILITLATAAGSVTMVNALVSIQPLIVFALALFISAYYPHIFKEDTAKAVVILKLVSILLIFTGAILIT